MKIGVVLPNADEALARADLIIRAAREAESMGWDSLWLNDHVVMPGKSVDDEEHVRARYASSEVLDAPSLLSALSVATVKVQIGVSVLILPYRHPLIVAKMVTTADVLSGGRVILGVGSGWMVDQFRALGVPYEERGELTDEHLEALLNIWADEHPNYNGKHVSFDGIRVAPLPTQRLGPPIWVGGRSRRAARRAVQFGAPWHPSHWSYQELSRNLSWVNEEAERLERPLPGLTFRLRWDGGMHDDMAVESVALPSDYSEAVARLHVLEELGVSHLVVELPAPTADAYLSRIEDFADNVLQRYRG